MILLFFIFDSMCSIILQNFSFNFPYFSFIVYIWFYLLCYFDDSPASIFFSFISVMCSFMKFILSVITVSSHIYFLCFDIVLSVFFSVFLIKKKLYGPFLWMRFNCLKARATSRRQFTFHHQVSRNPWYSFYWPRKDEQLSQPWSHPVVLNTGPLDWESRALTTRPLLLNSITSFLGFYLKIFCTSLMLLCTSSDHLS